ncbi:MAG: endonuclease domain-containing protein [Candidatus Peribacteraceae bacterium]|nr:endonuclease domain-containing protein [Candidatus Peribacteraceae bacterium]
MNLVHPLPLALEHAKDLRKRLTQAESVLWNIVRNRKFHGYKFRRQGPLGRFIVDFLCMKPPLIIELDGKIHDTQLEYDKERTESIFEDFGIPVLRLSNEEVLEHLPLALKKIEAALTQAREKK